MAPNVIAPPPDKEARAATPGAKEKRLQPGRVAENLSTRAVAVAPEDRAAAHQPRFLFADSLLDLSATRPRRRTGYFFLSLIAQVFAISILLLIPLIYTDAIDLRQFTQTMLVAPPPPPAPPPPAAQPIAKTPAPKRVFMQAGKLLAPTAIPKEIAMLKEEAPPPDAGVGVVGGVPGGVPGGAVGGVIGGIISSAAKAYIPIAPAAAPKAPIRVGGRIKAPRALSTPSPVYPVLAQQTRLQGDVVIDAVIDEAGNVVEMKVISGHPLLIPAAMDALRKWKYEPTYLNDVAVPVQLLVTIRFRLGV